MKDFTDEYPLGAYFTGTDVSGQDCGKFLLIKNRRNGFAVSAKRDAGRH